MTNEVVFLEREKNTRELSANAYLMNHLEQFGSEALRDPANIIARTLIVHHDLVDSQIRLLALYYERATGSYDGLHVQNLQIGDPPSPEFFIEECYKVRRKLADRIEAFPHKVDRFMTPIRAAIAEIEADSGGITPNGWSDPASLEILTVPKGLFDDAPYRDELEEIVEPPESERPKPPMKAYDY